jgi:four helix bundle protein
LEKGRDLTVRIYQVVNEGHSSKDFGLRDQMRRSGVRIPSNIAEGDERDTDKEAVSFFYMEKASLTELRTQIEFASEILLLPKSSYVELENQCLEFGLMLGKLIKARSKSFKKENIKS